MTICVKKYISETENSWQKQPIVSLEEGYGHKKVETPLNTLTGYWKK